MIIVGNVVLSDDVKEQFFVCNLKKCQGACCVEGDSGAPLEKEELAILDEIYEDVKPFLTKDGIREIEKQGKHTTDRDNDHVTPIINGRECVYATRDKQGTLKCGIEQAYQAGKTSFRKPISCHLYPLRIDTYDNYDAVNYHRWYICNPACDLGRELGVPLYRFLKEPLIRKYGEDWYNELVDKIERG